MAKKNPYRKGSNKWIYFNEIQNLKRRARDWERKYHISYTNIPSMPEVVTKKDIARVRNIRFKNLSEAEIKEARFNYQWKYEREKLPNQYKPTKEFTPRTEKEFFEDSYHDKPEEPEPIGNKPSDSHQDIDMWLENIFNEVLDYDDNGKNDEVRAILEGLLESARNRLGSEGLYNYLEDGNNVIDLHTHATNALSGSPDANGRISSHQSHEIDQFAQILNLGRPLTQEQSMTLQQEGFVSYDYSDID